MDIKDIQEKRRIVELLRKACGILLGVVMVLLCMMANTKQVRADAIATYSASSLFIDREMSDWIEIGFPIYKTNGPDGEVVIYNKPAGNEIVATVKNGKKFNARQAYEDAEGNFWVYYVDFAEEINGWVRHNHLTGKYTIISFSEEFKDQLIEEEWDLVDMLIGGTEVYYWKYPGSTELSEVGYPMGNMIYVDEMGRKWGRMNTYEWVCIDAPEADFETLYPNGAPERGQKSETDREWMGLSGTAWYSIAGVGVLIVFIIGITLRLLKKLK